MTEQQLRMLVESFYARVREDELIGSLFNDAIQDWPEHLEQLTAFWSSVMLTSGRYKGSPLAAHQRHADRMKPSMFVRWLEIWRRTAREVLEPSDAEAVIARAERIAESLQLGLFFRIDRPRAA